MRFDPVASINSGQVFLWEKLGSTWYGAHADKIITFTFSDEGDPLFQSYPEGSKNMVDQFFRLDDDLCSIFSSLCSDPFVQSLISTYPGLRLLRQDPAQCAISFVCASNTNIPMIRRMLSSLSRKFGHSISVDGKEFHTFPRVDDLDIATEGELRACGLGYRAKAVKSVTKAIVDGSLDFEFLKRAPYDEAKRRLTEIYGIGPKIADCILLFSLEKLEAFPIDVWIARVLASQYSWLASERMSEKLTKHQYELVSLAAQRYFGKYAGYAQQFLYYHMRQRAGKKW